MPACRSMDSRPYQRNQMAFPHYYQSGIEGIPPQMNLDPSKSTFAYEQQWPHGSYIYPTPMQLCCGHHKFPGYCTYKPAYPHIPAPSPMYYYEGSPTYPEPFYVPYAPLPHYTMELPRYEYDKCVPRGHHCCGCPNYPLSLKEGKSVKIEEHEPDDEKKVNSIMAPIELRNYPYPFVWFPPDYMGSGSGELMKPVAEELGEPDVEKKLNNAGAPSQLKNYPYPLVWMPPHYVGNKDLKKPDAAEVDDQDKISHDRKPPVYARADVHDPKVWNGWFPLDVNNLSNMIQDSNGTRNKNRQIDDMKRESEDGRANQSQQSGRNMREFPFPVIWIPNYNMQEGERMNDWECANSIKDVPHALNSAPVTSCSSNDVSNRSDVNGNDTNVGDSDVTRNEIGAKIIPVKQMEFQKSDSEGHERKVRDIPVKQMEGNMTGKESPSSAERQSNSPKKTSKLPPVCLRVDPLPRKKNGNGSPRSPSSSKEHSEASANGRSKASVSSSLHDNDLADVKLCNAPNVSGDIQPKEKTIKVMERSPEKKDDEWSDGSEIHDTVEEDAKLRNDSTITVEGKPKNKSIKVLEKSSEKKHENEKDGSQGQITSNIATEVHENGSALTSTEESQTNGEKISMNEVERNLNDMIKDESREAKGTTKIKVLSDTDAAVLIQAAYRGFQVRKWELLKKLEEVAEVRKHVTDVKARIQALETYSNCQIIERERVTIGENIMRLLLKLDTIQGLHPSFREMRKSVARDLTSLQEKLDSITAKKSQQQMEDIFVKKRVEEPPLVGLNGECMHQQREEKDSTAGKDSSESIIPKSQGSPEQRTNERVVEPEKDSSNSIMMGQCQDQLSMKDGNPSMGDERLESVIHNLPFHDDKWKSRSPIDPVINKETEPLPKETITEDVNQVSAVEASGSGISEAHPQTKSELVDIPEVDDLDMKAWEQLPRGDIDDLEVDDLDCGNNKKNEIEGEELQVLGVPMTSGDSFGQDGASIKIREMGELPVGLLDDNTVKSDFEKHEETGTSVRVLQTREGECNAAPVTYSSADDISKEAQLDQQQQPLEEQEEMQSTEGSDDRVKVESEKDELKSETPQNAQVESDSKEENNVTVEFIGNDAHGVNNGDACFEAKEAPAVETLEEEVVLKETQSETGGFVIEQGINVDAENREALDEQMGEPSMTPPPSKGLLISKRDGEMNNDQSLVEENEKLRKMMQKLLEAGNEQLTVISNLTGRVKDLEKKLARKKRVRKIHCRPTSKPPCKK